MLSVPTPARIKASQLSHRHPRYWKTNPPMTGPVTGPFSGAMDHSDTVRARYSSVETSTMVPALFAIMAAPKIALWLPQELDTA